MCPWRCSSRLVHWTSYHRNCRLRRIYHITFVFDIGNLKCVAGFSLYQEINSLLIKHVNHVFYHTAAMYNVVIC
jgi:hypothetical protein